MVIFMRNTININEYQLKEFDMLIKSALPSIRPGFDMLIKSALPSTRPGFDMLIKSALPSIRPGFKDTLVLVKLT